MLVLNLAGTWKNTSSLPMWHLCLLKFGWLIRQFDHTVTNNSLTDHRQITTWQPTSVMKTVGCQLVDCWLTVGWLLVDCWLTVGHKFPNRFLQQGFFFTITLRWLLEKLKTDSPKWLTSITYLVKYLKAHVMKYLFVYVHISPNSYKMITYSSSFNFVRLTLWIIFLH